VKKFISQGNYKWTDKSKVKSKVVPVP